MWTKDVEGKMTWDEAFEAAQSLSIGGYDDWRVPTIKELYSLIDFRGVTGKDEGSSTPYINTDYFNQPFGDTSAGERFIDAQTWSSTNYVSTTMLGDETVFGVNFIDGRIKGYPLYDPRTGSEHKLYVRFVRANENYGNNDFVDNENGTISDLATGLIWQQSDSGEGKNWEEALAYCENLELAGLNNWRLPNIKEMQSLVDYERSPDTSESAAIDPLFEVTTITNEAGDVDYPAYWSSTTHLDGINPGSTAAYVSFGRSLGYMRDRWVDVHGAGAQRSDPKTGDPDDFPTGRGPQGDAIRIYNFVRCVSSSDVETMQLSDK
jgi:hypothetical protein